MAVELGCGVETHSRYAALGRAYSAFGRQGLHAPPLGMVLHALQGGQDEAEASAGKRGAQPRDLRKSHVSTHCMSTMRRRRKHEPKRWIQQ